MSNAPTYVLIDEQGVVLDRTDGLSGSLVSTLREAVEGGSAPLAALRALVNREQVPSATSRGDAKIDNVAARVIPADENAHFLLN